MRAKIFSISSFLLFLSTPTMACGIYQINGVVRSSKTGYKIVVAEGSKSETVFSSSHREEVKLFPYIGLPVSTSVMVLKPFDGTRAQIEKIQSIDLRAPDPLKGNDSRFELAKKMNCRK